MPLTLPDAGRAAWWLTAWLRGHAPVDDVIDAVTADDAAHDVAGLPGETGTTPLVLALGALRRTGATEAGLALPAEGDLVGLGGPRDLTDAALDAGEAVVLGPLLPGQDGWGLVPHRAGRGVVWRVLPARRRQLVDVGQADRDLRAALGTAATTLADLEVARWRPEVADALMDLRHLTVPSAPPGVPARCAELAARGLQALGIVDLALVDDGGALTAYEVGARRSALDPLGRAGRRALVAACSPEAWPPA